MMKRGTPMSPGLLVLLLALVAPLPLSAIERGCAAPGANPLSYWTTISRGLGVFEQPGIGPPGGNRSAGAMPRHTLRLMFPVAVAARSNDVFIYDHGHRAILRYDMARETLVRFADVGAGRPEADLFVGADLAVYFANSFAREVVRFAPTGAVVQHFASTAELPRPVGVVTGRSLGEVLVADGMRAHILIFNQLGTAFGSLGARLRGGVNFSSIAAISRSGDRIYVVDQVARRIFELGLSDGHYESFGEAHLGMPSAVAADRFGRVFVADAADQAIKLFRDGALTAVIGGPEAAADMRFAEVSDLWIDQDYLFVADAPSARVRVMLIEQPCP